MRNIDWEGTVMIRCDNLSSLLGFIDTGFLNTAELSPLLVREAVKNQSTMQMSTY